MKYALLISAFVMSSSSMAVDEVTLVNPQASTLRAISLDQREHFAKFKGEIRVDGTLYVSWDSVRRPPVAEYRLIPSPDSSKRLPHFRGYRVTWIEPLDGAATLRSAVDEATFKRVLSTNSKFHVTGTWLVTDYDVGVECDSPYAHASIRAASAPVRQIAAYGQVQSC